MKLEYVCHMGYDQSGPSRGPCKHPSPPRSTLVHMAIEFQLQKKLKKNVHVKMWWLDFGCHFDGQNFNVFFGLESSCHMDWNQGGLGFGPT